MMDFLPRHGVELTGYAYEIVMNDFVIARKEDYVTQIMIRIKD